MDRVSPFLWFDGQAEAAAELYTSVFPDCEVVRTLRHLDDTAGTPGDVLMVTLRLGGQTVFLLNGGPHYATPGNVSLYYRCRDQAEIDRCWEMLGEGGEHMMCSWLKDRFGILWQIVPAVLDEMFASPDEEAVKRMLHAVWGMTKLDLAAIRVAYDG
jgi:predicted 3-demethylubiquinone-9 3-methyltransferase (glyoxalase superfamily)